ncbi:30S ribosomal protein S5 [Qipengyuania spongiae]|uniref:Small ribosomal subunit protein uS5 n=1 Tax=Qipengyuania spongiae TaxID=2909673 RepID=A0ABY5SV47_9SPHN|nr:30S ribosomal protein S5 [Qipengyuania spongiae]UVI38200.1 30S ribosomal protein S5 [Qipengyuania spongiae]
MMADENTTEENQANTAPAETPEVAKAKADSGVVEAQTENAVTNEKPAIADTPSEAEANQDPAQGAEGQPEQRGRGGRGGRDNRGGGDRDRGRGRGGRDNRRGNRREEEDDGIIEKLVHINRVSKTVKGGKRFGFAALVVVGDGSGRVGFGKGKAREVPEAISKATAAARKHMVRVPLKEGRTLHHDGNGRFGAGKVTVRTAPPGTGIIAGGPMRAVFESLGVSDVVTKSVGTSNPYNMIRATFDALTNQTSPKSVAQRRGKKVADLLGRGGASEAEAHADAAAVAE